MCHRGKGSSSETSEEEVYIGISDMVLVYSRYILTVSYEKKGSTMMATGRTKIIQRGGGEATTSLMVTVTRLKGVYQDIYQH